MPVRAGVSLGDMLAALHGAIGVLLPLQARAGSIRARGVRRPGQVVSGGNGDPIFQHLMTATGRDDLSQDIALTHNVGRAEQAGRLDAAITAWTVQRSVAEVVATLRAASVPVGPHLQRERHCRGPALPSTWHAAALGHQRGAGTGGAGGGASPGRTPVRA